MPKLTYTVGGEQKTFEVKDSCSIGRVPENDIALKDEAGSSRRHCQILKIREGVYELSDLGSTNGTKVNGQAVKRHKLQDGDVIRIGETQLAWSDGSGASGGAGGEEEILLEEPAGASAPKSAPSSGGGTSEQCYLVFAGGPKDGQKLALDKKRVTFGRNPKNTYPLEDAGCSGYHCEISREGGAYLLRDLGSTNGTLVDGEPVSETALAHGARIRIGGTRFVFVDPTVSDFEKAMSSVDDLGSEWGLLRAEMDLDRVQRARRGQAIAVGGLFVVLAGAGWVAFAHPEWLSGKEPPIPELAGQKFQDFSLEEGTATFAADAESGGVARIGNQTDGGAHQGTQFLVVSREGRPGRGATAMCSQLTAVSSGTAYTFGAQVRTKGGGAAVVRTTWLGSDKKSVVGRSATDVTTSDSWKEVRRTVMPPTDAVWARLDFVNAGGGAAHFDDIYFGTGASVAANEITGGNLRWTVTADGQGTLRTADRTLFAGATVVAGVLSQAVLDDDTRRPDSVGSQVITSSAGGGWSGSVWDPSAGSLAEFKVEAKIEEDRYLVLSGKVPEGAALVLPLAASENGISVRTSSFFRVADKRAVDHVRGLTVGDREPWEVNATGESAIRLGFIRVGETGKETWALAIGGDGKESGGAFNVRVDTDSRSLIAEVESIKKAAADALQRRNLGSAIQLHRKLASKLAQGSGEADAAAQTADKLELEGVERFQKLSAARAAAIEFQDDSAMADLLTEANAIAQIYKDHDLATKATAEAASIVEATKVRAVTIAERRAAPLMRRAADLEGRGQKLLAGEIYKGIESDYAGTKAANDAQAARERLASQK